MAELKWNAQLEVGVKVIDEQHKELLRIANGLIKAVSLGRGRKTLENVMRRLREYTVLHFNSEERLMDEVGYPHRIQHIDEHANLKRGVKEFQAMLYKHEDLTPGEVLGFMKGWLLQHILDADMRLARFINRKDIEEG